MIEVLFEPIRNFFEKNWKKIGTAFIILGGGAATAGTVKVIKSNNINKTAEGIQKDAQERHDKAEKILIQKLDGLGQTEKNIITSFDDFANVIEHIHNRPVFDKVCGENGELPKIELQEMKQLSTNLETFIETSVGAGIGSLAGLAFFGATTVALSPGLLAAGVVLCVKGCGLKKHAIENLQQAEKMRDSVAEIVSYYEKLQIVAEQYNKTLTEVYGKYIDYLKQAKDITMQKSNWNEFNGKEKKIVENLCLFVGLLYKMCKVKLIVEKGSKDKLEKINIEEINECQQEAKRYMAECA